MENGSDLRNRVLILEERATTLAESLQQLVKIVRGISWELSGAVGALNEEIWSDRAEAKLDTRPFSDLNKRLEDLDAAIEKLGEP
jgi:hypothetical protein